MPWVTLLKVVPRLPEGNSPPCLFHDAFPPHCSILPQSSLLEAVSFSFFFFLFSSFFFLPFSLFLSCQLCSPWLCTRVAMVTARASLHPKAVVLPWPWEWPCTLLPLRRTSHPLLSGMGVPGDIPVTHLVSREGTCQGTGWHSPAEDGAMQHLVQGPGGQWLGWLCGTALFASCCQNCKSSLNVFNE